MTEPMTARELAERCWQEFAFVADPYDTAIASIERAILDALAAERARLAQSGDVEAEALRMFAATSETQGSASFIEAAWRDLSERQRQIFRTLADYSIASRTATAEAARIEARDAIARLFDRADFKEVANTIRALQPDELEKKA